MKKNLRQSGLKKIKHEHKKAFSLAEVLIASFIFVMVGLIGVTVFVNVLKIQRRINLENTMYEDARFLMERISREIRRNTVDYEEYYNKLVEQKNYGEKYGCYGSRFYNPGSDNAYGALCTPAGDPNCVVDKTSLDSNSGQNPFAGNSYVDKDPDAASAFCDKNLGSNLDPFCGNANQAAYQLQDQLYLIDGKGEKKTLFATKNILVDNQNVNSVGLLELEGEDNDHDGIVEQWKNCNSGSNAYCCAKNFICTGNLEASLHSANSAQNYLGFVPISPSRTTVTKLKFIIAPLEDPRKAFAESTPDIQQQPHVTVLLTVQPSALVLQNYSGEIPSITLQTTITSRVYNEVKSFWGQNVCGN